MAAGVAVKVLVTRTDRLGDLVLSLPVFAYLAVERPDWQVQAMVAPSAVPLVENDPNVSVVWTWSDADDGAANDDLVARLRAEDFDAAVMLQFRPELARLLRRAGIDLRFGPLSKWSSWTLLNRGSWQRRSRGHRHEMVHNLNLARRLTHGWWGVRGGGDSPCEPCIHLEAGQYETGQRFRRERAPGSRVVAFIHPGSGGSALDWPAGQFATLANALALQPGWQVFVTGSGGDATQVEAMRNTGLDSAVTVLLDEYPLRDFLGVLAAGDLFVGPSTGPLHMAAALHLATVGLFPPVPAMSPTRWGQRGRWNQVLVPDVRCPGRRVCLQGRCSLYNCLSAVGVDDVLAAAVSAVRRRDGAPGPWRVACEEDGS